MKCAQCEQEIKGCGILLNADGDFACSTACQTAYEQEKEHFFNMIVHDAKLCEAWLRGECPASK